MKVKLIQNYPLRYAGVLYQPEAEFDAADKHAAAMVARKQAAGVKKEPSPAERKAALKAALIELQKRKTAQDWLERKMIVFFLWEESSGERGWMNCLS